MAPPAKSAPVPNRALPPKDAKAFKELLGDYEQKAWKKALKTADGILAKKPEHGETLCMKGLVLQNMGKSDEGYELVKQGLRNDIDSHICWHVHALMLKADRRYREALDCYMQAIGRERDQANLIRDAVSLQLYFRMFDEVIELRARMLRLQPTLRSSWLGMVVALHLAGRNDEASEMLVSYLDMNEDVPRRDYETSEAILLQAILLRERGLTEDAVHWLDGRSHQVVDRPAFDRLRGELLLGGESAEAAVTAWTALFEANPEDRRNIEGYLRARGVVETSSEALAVVDELVERAPKSTALRLYALRLDAGEGFERRARVMLQDWLVKGVPSLFVALRPLYVDEAKRSTLERIVEDYRDSLERTGCLDAPSGDGATAPLDAPTAYLWTLYYLAQHYSHLGRHAEALRSIDAALEHTPVLGDLLMMRSRLLKRAGDLVGAERAMTAARLLDGQDRFLNCKAVKYLLRIDQPDEAERIAGLFTRKDAVSPLTDLVDLQALWFIQEQGDTYRRLGKLNLALKRYHQVEKIFNDFRDDESDFHTWCQRKGTMRTYLNLLKWEDTVRAHPAYAKAAEAAVAVYLELDARPATPQTNGTHVTNGDAESEEAARKAAKKAKKAEAKARAAGFVSSDPKKDEPVVVADPDPNGDKLLATMSPLEEAHKFVQALELAAPSRLQTWLLSFDVALRRQRLLEALKAVRYAMDVERDSPEVHVRLAELFTAVGKLGRDEPLHQYLRKAVAELSPVLSIDAANAELLQRNGGSPAHIFAAARALLAARGAEAKAEIEGLLFQLVHEETRVDLDVLQAALKLLRSAPLSSSRADEFRDACAARLPLANAFMTPEALERHKLGLSATGLAASSAAATPAGEETRETLDV